MKNWLDFIQSKLPSDDIIKFLRNGYSGDQIVPLTVSSLKSIEEKAYISDYLAKYLSDCVDEEIKNKYDMHREAVIDTIESVFQTEFQEEFHSPLYLSIFIELWIYHDGNQDIHTGEELLEMYMEKEEARWKKVLGDDALVYGYAKALTIACVLDGFCISIPYGDTSGKTYKNVEIGMVDQYVRSKRSPGKKKTDWSQIFIKEYGRKEIEYLPFVRRPSITFGGIFDGKVFEEDELIIPEYDEYFAIEPQYPDLIREFIVGYYLQADELEKFAKVIRRIDIGRLRIVSFLSHAIEDFPDEVCFRKIMTARSDNIHEHYVFMKTLILTVQKIWFKSLDDIKAVLLESKYTAYVETDCEVSIWGMMAECLTFMEDSERLLEFGMDFFDYLESRWNTLAIVYIIPEIRAYSRGFFLLDDLDSMVRYAERMDRFAESAAEYILGVTYALMPKLFVHYFLSKMYFYRYDREGFEHEFSIIRSIGRPNMKDEYISCIYSDVLNMQLGMWLEPEDMPLPEALQEVTIDLEKIYADHKSEYSATVLSIAYVTEYDKYWRRKETESKKMLNKLMRNVKQLLNAYTDNQDILISYILLLCNKIIACEYRYSIVSDENGILFEKLFMQRPDLVEIMAFYVQWLNYKMDRPGLADDEYVYWTGRYFDCLIRMAETFQELEKDPKFTYPREYTGKVRAEKADKVFNEWLSMWKENFIKDVLEAPSYDANAETAVFGDGAEPMT